MASTLPSVNPSEQLADRADRGLDVDWLLHKKDPHGNLKRNKSSNGTDPAQAEPSPFGSWQKAGTRATAAETEDSVDPFHVHQNQNQNQPQAQNQSQNTTQTNGANRAPTQDRKPSVASSQRGPTTPTTPTFPRTRPQDESKQSKTPPKKDGRRASWFSSLSSKLSSDKHARSGSTDVAAAKKSPAPSPALEKSNPLEVKRNGSQDIPPEEKPVHVGPRRPSVLVAAGTETKLDHQPGFLSSALRRLSSGNTAHLGKAPATTGALCPRKVMSIDQNRQRTKIADFDQNRLRRVAFKVDVEIAGIAAQADEQPDQSSAASSASAAAVGSPPGGKEVRMAKYKDRSEGAALKKSTSREDQSENQVERPPEAKSDIQEEQKKAQVEEAIKQDEEDVADQETEEKPTGSDGAPSTRRKEKKKRSEAERKERKEKKRRQAEANGLIPLELTVDEDSDDSANGTPAGASTPKKGQPTTDPLRIYKRCCQLRETTALPVVKEQISKPSATLAEAPGTVASIDLTGTEMSLADVQTLGDWLAVVPVRRLIMDDCNLTDEGVRIVLSGLSGCKSQEQAKANRKLPSRASGKSGVEQMGVIEKLSLKNSTNISVIGWRHIALFIHMSQSLRAIDLAGIPFPSTADGELFRTSLTSTNLTSGPEPAHRRIDLSTLFARALVERFGDCLEELILSDCGLSSHAATEIVESAITCKIKRLGLANNNLNQAAFATIVKYITSDICEGLDIGGNDLSGTGHILTEVLDDKNPLFAMSLAGCNLGVDEVRLILQHLSVLKNFKFIDLSRNHELFASPDGVALLRRRLPQLKELKRIHLSDVNMTPNQIISLSEIFPDCPSLAHVSILDNQKLVECMNSKEGEAQEEACAVFVSLMTAVRASTSLVAVEIEVPSQESSEVIKALASQVVAYGLRNLEKSALPDIGIQQEAGGPPRSGKQAPEVLLNVIGHMEGYPQNHDSDEPAPDEDYVIASTGIVKALGVCLGNDRVHSRNMSPSASGTATPKSGHLHPPGGGKKPRDVSLELCESARKIRMRLRPAMIKEDQAGNVEAYRRLMYLDQTLERTIKRFEDEYPESKPKAPGQLSAGSRASSYLDDPSGQMSRVLSREEGAATSAGEETHLTRSGSNASLAARALTQEEGRMHRFGQGMRRQVLAPHGQDDALHGTSANDEPESPHLAALRGKLEVLSGEEIREQVEHEGVDKVIKELGLSAQELASLEKDDPESFAKLKNSQLAAAMNSQLVNQQVTMDRDPQEDRQNIGYAR